MAASLAPADGFDGAQILSFDTAVTALSALGERPDVIDTLHAAAGAPRGVCVSAADVRAALACPPSLCQALPPTLPSVAWVEPRWATDAYSLLIKQHSPLSGELEVRLPARPPAACAAKFVGLFAHPLRSRPPRWA